MTKINGGCHCKSVRYEVNGDIHMSAICHCPSCRKSSGAPLVAWAMFDKNSLVCESADVISFSSSPGVERLFCGKCGTTLFFTADYIPGLVDVTIQSFDNPEIVIPDMQIWCKHETACVKNIAKTHRFEELPPQS